MKTTGRKRNHRPGRGARKTRAATSDILGRPKRRRVNPRWARHYRHLVELRDYFLKQRGLSSEDANEQHPAYSQHPADAATDTFDRDVALGMLSSDQDALFEIEDAIRRVESGSYGVCELTGKKIPAARLQAIPWTRFSVEAGKRLEAQGQVNRTGLGRAIPLSSVSAADNETEEGEAGESAG